jgi:hypothetical protein
MISAGDVEKQVRTPIRPWSNPRYPLTLKDGLFSINDGFDSLYWVRNPLPKSTAATGIARGLGICFIPRTSACWPYCL